MVASHSQKQVAISVAAISVAVGIDILGWQIFENRSDAIAAAAAQRVVLARASEMG